MFVITSIHEAIHVIYAVCALGMDCRAQTLRVIGRNDRIGLSRLRRRLRVPFLRALPDALLQGGGLRRFRRQRHSLF